MEKETFHQHLQAATEIVLEFTRRHCFNDFPDEYRYLIVPHGRTMDPGGEHLTATEVAVLGAWNRHERKALAAMPRRFKRYFNSYLPQMYWRDHLIFLFLDYDPWQKIHAFNKRILLRFTPAYSCCGSIFP